jgi:hypothetical protein
MDVSVSHFLSLTKYNSSSLEELEEVGALLISNVRTSTVQFILEMSVL